MEVCSYCGDTFQTRGTAPKYCSKSCGGLARRRPLAVRLWSRVNQSGPDECWEWTGARTRDGYGSIGLDFPGHGTMLTHRAAYLLTHGALPDGEVCHSCDNPPCCNPRHLFAGSHATNMADAVAKGRFTGPNRARGERNGGNKYSAELIQRVRELSDSMSQQRIADETGISQTHISRILRGKMWHSLPPEPQIKSST